jgi:hypothetical protein
MASRVLAEPRQRSGALRRTLTGLVLVVGMAGALYAGWQAYTGFERAADRRALDARQLELASRALAPGSPLACLDGAAGETVENACEKIVFARPETVAAAVAYVGARLSLLSDGLRYAGQGDAAYAVTLAGLRRAIELDRFGIAAHILSTRDGCSPDHCSSFVLMRDTTALKANIGAHAFDKYVARYAGGWNEEKQTPVAETAPVASAPATPAAPGVTAAVPLSSKYDFPSAASIPPVSIMNAEPPLPKSAITGQAPAAQAESPEGAAPVPPKRPAGQAAGTR